MAPSPPDQQSSEFRVGIWCIWVVIGDASLLAVTALKTYGLRKCVGTRVSDHKCEQTRIPPSIKVGYERIGNGVG